MTKMSKTIKTLLAGLAASLFVAAPASANDFSVMNGEEIMLYSFPWYVSLNATGYDTNSSFYCGGSLIHSNWVMTAAHCVVDNRKKPYRISAVVGHHWLSTSNPDQIAVKRVVVHPNYNPYNNDSDIALLELTAPVPNAVTIRPGWPALPIQNGTQAIAVGHGTTVPLINYLVDRFNLSIGCQINLHTCVREMFDQGQTPVQVLDNLLLANGMGDPKKGVGYINLVYRLLQLGYSSANNGMSTAEIVGGFALLNRPYDEIADIVFDATQPDGTDELRQVMLPLLNDINECAKQTGMEITPNMLCAGYGKKLPKDTCQGDSGGPLMTYDRFGNRVQVGIVSSGPVCGDSYGIYTRVANYLDWIGGIVPFSNAERVFNYVENITTMLYLPIGHEQSQYYMPYWGRYYPASNIGLGTDNITLYNYDVPTATRFPIGDFAAWFVAASHAGY